MRIERAHPEDYQSVRRFYHALIDAMQDHEYRPGWQKDVYPSQAQLRTAIDAGNLYVGLGREGIVAAMVVDYQGNEQYAQAAWSTDLQQGEYQVIHMLGVHADHARQGLAKQMVAYALDLARSAGMRAVRLDVLKGNLPAERLYEGFGFSLVSTLSMYYEDTGWTDFKLYELPLT